MTTATASKPAAKTETTKVESKNSDAVESLASIYEGHIKVDKSGTAVVDDDMIEANLPQDFSMALMKRSQKIRSEIVAAAVLALGRKSLPVLDKNKDLEKVHTVFKIGNDKVDLAIEREREFNDGKGGKLKKFGYVNMGYTVTGATNSGEFKKARQQLAEEGTKLFGG